MIKLNKVALTTLSLLGIITLSPLNVFAQSYGNTPNTPSYCLNVDQMVSNPAVTKTIEYIDNISPSDTKYQANSTFVARMKIKNVSNVVVPAVKVTNTIPQYVYYFAGPGSLSQDGRVLTIDAGDLQAGEEKYFYVTYKTANADQLPADKSMVFVSNLISAQGSSCNRDEDAAQIGIEKLIITKGGVNPIYQEQLQAVKTAPKAGPEMGVALLGLNALVGSVGYFLKKKLA
ncbi:MAG: hypothetical protein WCJ70_00815 [bacterium]